MTLFSEWMSDEWILICFEQYFSAVFCVLSVIDKRIYVKYNATYFLRVIYKDYTKAISVLVFGNTKDTLNNEANIIWYCQIPTFGLDWEALRSLSKWIGSNDSQLLLCKAHAVNYIQYTVHQIRCVSDFCHDFDTKLQPGMHKNNSSAILFPSLKARASLCVSLD